MTSTSMRGYWPEFFRQEGPQLDQAQAAMPEHVPCPLPGHFHSRDGFRLFKDFAATGGGVCNTCGTFSNGVALFAALKGVSKQAAEATVSAWRAADPSRPLPVVQTTAQDPAEIAANRRQTISQMLAEALPVEEGTPVHRYLLGRGLTLEQGTPSRVLYHPMLSYWGTPVGKTRTELVGRFPVMLAPILAPDGQVVSIHRTFLTLSGQKAPVTPAKKILPAASSLRGSAIRLFERAGPVLHVAEGIETCLAVADITAEGSFWAAGNAGALETLAVPSSFTEVHIWADADESRVHNGREVGQVGQRAATVLAARLKKQGIATWVHVPKVAKGGSGSLDWLDVRVQQDLGRLQTAYLAFLRTARTAA